MNLFFIDSLDPNRKANVLNFGEPCWNEKAIRKEERKTSYLILNTFTVSYVIIYSVLPKAIRKLFYIPLETTTWTLNKNYVEAVKDSPIYFYPCIRLPKIHMTIALGNFVSSKWNFSKPLLLLIPAPPVLLYYQSIMFSPNVSDFLNIILSAMNSTSFARKKPLSN